MYVLGTEPGSLARAASALPWSHITLRKQGIFLKINVWAGEVAVLV